ncbi:MAG: alanine racemase [Gammaproteobacteria bacterium]|nr:MAG: alanine racemase [Gammaproteobacteria bacterium]
MADVKSYSSRPVLTVNLTALAENYKYLAAKASPAKVGASVKADAYGLGAAVVGRALYGAGCRIFFVAHAGEGKILRTAIGSKASIYVLSGNTPQDTAIFFGSKLKPVINSLTQARDWVKACQPVKHAPRTALHFDTGINRLGIPKEEAEIFATDKTLLTDLDVDLVMSHLACSGEPNHPLNAIQLARFKKIAGRMPMVPLSLANTGAIYLGPEYRFKLVRTGIGLYGGKITDNPQDEQVKPVVELHAPVLQIKTVKAGETLGYNASFTAKNDMKIAIVSAGYADGLPVNLSGSDKRIVTSARLGKSRVDVIGRVSMDYTILDITDYDGFVELGAKAVFFGEDLENQAAHAHMINYEVMTHLGARCRKIYVNE